MKQCTKCKIEYPATTEFFYADKRCKDGLYSWCSVCHKNTTLKYQQTDKGKKTRLKYNQSKKGKTIQRRYFNTVGGHLRQVFSAMKRRCNNPNHWNYNRYGGRGIELRFTSNEFVDYVVNVLKVNPIGLQIDRIDNDGHYEVGNIRFVTAKENCNNRRNST